MLELVPELGPSFMVDTVLSHFISFVWEKNAAGEHDIPRRAFAYMEWLHEHGPPDLAERVRRGMFSFGVTWPPAAKEWLGPRTSAALRGDPAAPPQLVDRDA
jgi:hypothetical protein